jgi:DNA-binding IclR family transcriptional regulator
MSDSRITSRRQVPAVTRAVAILRRLGKSSEPVGVNQLARDLDLVPSTCLHILRVLIDEGLVAFDCHSKRYSIDVGILPIARGAIQRNNFASLIEPRLTELSHDVGGTIVATQLADADHMVVVALSRARQPFRLQVDLGSRFPALISATGRCHAAFNLGDVSQARLKSRFAALKWDHPPDYRTWKKEIQKTRLDDFAIDSGDYISGVTIIAVPFLNRGGFMTHSIVAIDITERAEAIGIENITGKMQAIRNELSDVLIEGVS